MAKKQTRRSISVSRTTYERLKAFCETNNISMSQLVETRVNDFLGPNDVAGAPGMIQMASASAGVSGAGVANVGAVVMPSMPRPMAPRPIVPAAGAAIAGTRPVESRPGATQAQPAASTGGAPPSPMTS